MAPSPTRSPSPSPSPSYAHPGVVVVRGDGAPAPPAHGGGAGGGGASSKSSSLEEVVLSESSYLKGLSEIIERDFFPSLKANRARSQLLSAQRSHDIPAAIAASALLADIRDGVLPSNGLQDGDAPLTTPSGRPLSLDEFARKYTSEDNASYAKLAAVEAARRRAKRKWTHRDSGATGDARETNAFALPPPPPPRKTLALTAGPGATAAAATKTATTKAPARVAAASTRFPVDEGHALGWAPSSVASSAATTPSTSQAWSPDVDQPRTFGMFQERERERVARAMGIAPTSTPYLRRTRQRGGGRQYDGISSTPTRLSAAAQTLLARTPRRRTLDDDWQLAASYGGSTPNPRQYGGDDATPSSSSVLRR